MNMIFFSGNFLENFFEKVKSQIKSWTRPRNFDICF